MSRRSRKNRWNKKAPQKKVKKKAQEYPIKKGTVTSYRRPISQTNAWEEKSFVAPLPSIRMAGAINPDLSLYKMNQTGTSQYIRDLLKLLDIPYVNLRSNMYSVRYPGRPLFVAHLDSLVRTTQAEPLCIKDGILERVGPYSLGADNKAGVDLLLQNIEDINFCFVANGLQDCEGARNLIHNTQFKAAIGSLPCAFEFDMPYTRGYSAYCESDLTSALESVTHYRSAKDLFGTDLGTFDSIIPGINLSCGVFNGRTNYDTLDLEAWREAGIALQILNKECQGKFDLPKVPSDWHDPDLLTASAIKGSYEYTPSKITSNGVEPIKDYYNSYQEYWREKYLDAPVDELDKFESGEIIPDGDVDEYDYLDDEGDGHEPHKCECCGHAEDGHTDFYETSDYWCVCEGCLNDFYAIKRLR